MAAGLSPLLVFVLSVMLAAVFFDAYPIVHGIMVSASEHADAVCPDAEFVRKVHKIWVNKCHLGMQEARALDKDFSIPDHTYISGGLLNGAGPEAHPHQGSTLHIMRRGGTNHLAKDRVADDQAHGTPKQRHRRLLDANNSTSASTPRPQKPNKSENVTAKALRGVTGPTPPSSYYPGVSDDELVELLREDYSPAEAMGLSEDNLEVPVETFEDSKDGVAPETEAVSPTRAGQQDTAAILRPTADGQAGGADKRVPVDSGGAKSHVSEMPQPANGAAEMHAGRAAGRQPAVSAETPSGAAEPQIAGAAQVSGAGIGNRAGQTVPQTQVAGEGVSTGKTVGGDVRRSGGDTSGEAQGGKAAQIGREGDKVGASDVAAKDAADAAAGPSAGQQWPDGNVQGEGADLGPAGPDAGSDAGSAKLPSQLKSRWVSLDEASHHEKRGADGVGRQGPGAVVEGVPQESLEGHPVFISEQEAFAGSEDDYQDDGEDDPLEDEEEDELPKYVDLEKGRPQGVWERKARSKGYLDPDNNFDEFAKPSKKKRKRDEAKFFDFLTMREIRAEDASNKGGLTIAWAWDAVAGGNDLSDLWHVWEKRQEREFHTSLTFGTLISATGCVALVVWLISRCLKQRKKGQERNGSHGLSHPSPPRETAAQKVRKRRQLFAWTHNRSD